MFVTTKITYSQSNKKPGKQANFKNLVDKIILVIAVVSYILLVTYQLCENKVIFLVLSRKVEDDGITKSRFVATLNLRASELRNTKGRATTKWGRIFAELIRGYDGNSPP